MELKEICKSKGILKPVFVLDNARIHHYTGLAETVINEELQLFYLPPYSPFLNPIENVFSAWKKMVVASSSQNENELLLSINTSFTRITPEMCENLYRKMKRYIPRSRRREQIYE